MRGHEIRVVDYEILWRTEGKKELLSERHVIKNVSKIFPNAQITVIRPKILKVPILEYISMLLTYNREIKRQIIEFKPDIVVGHSILTNYLSMRWSKSKRIPYIFHMTDAQHTMIPFRFLRPIGKLIERKNLANAQRVVVINEKLKDYAISMGSDPEETFLVKAGIDLERYDPNIDGAKIREKYGINENDLVLFFMGWLYNFSGLIEVATELSRVDDKNRRVKLLIVGHGDAFDDLQKIRNNYHLEDRIILTGKQPYDKIPELIAASDICLLPAYKNDIMMNIVPIKMYEYMALGKPVIASNLPGIMKEFGDRNGVIYIDKPEDALWKGIDLAGNKRLMLEEGIKARKFIEKYSWDNVVDEFEAILKQTRLAKVIESTQ